MGMLIHKDISKAINEIVPWLDRVMKIRINLKLKAVTVIRAYAPTSESTEESPEISE